MTDRIAIALAQINPTVGAIAANIGRIRAARAEAAARSSDLVVCPQLSVTGCPLGDLATSSFFLDAVEAAVREFAAETSDGGPAVLLGAPWRSDGKVHDAALLLEAGAIATVRFRHVAPAERTASYSVGPVPGPLNFRGVRFGVLVGDDISTPDVAEALSECGAELLVHLSAVPFAPDTLDRRVGVAVARVTETGLPLLTVNLIGGQDDLVFDGSSFALGADRALKAHAPAFREALLVTRWERGGESWTAREGELAPPPSGNEAVWQALTSGLRDYVNKNGFATVVLGLSGGLDSAVAAAVAVDALGPDRVRPVFLPSPVTTRQSLQDAHEVAELLGCTLEKIVIDPALKAFETMLAPLVAGRDPDVTEENVQPRVRAVTLLQLSNKFGALVLSSLNRSDLYAGFFTLSGDVSNGFAILRDLYKTDIVALAQWRNGALPEGVHGPAGRVVPEYVINRPPCAELKPDRTDVDNLPPYDILDDILRCLIDQDLGTAAILERGHDLITLERVWRMVVRAEYKRRQAPPGVSLGLGKAKRFPITNGFAALS
ncbi:NAD+ synthase [Skermanella aerolata]|uniref:Glutamine-dependent NAD(+) synthetase n=1 Tax=Skermanella aerolata TaxID=393310 RepID=A0A512DHP1_9PROT|nr:NAD+ synthase [Skermanella aerolata]KJB94017.1 NAD synthetase [Skermanella aerolata KACC 11604]GEO35962.1 NAD+ synthase [Skermanella aerolata]